MNLIFMGPPGAGKGTQAEKITKKYSCIWLSTGDIFRAAVKAGTEIGKKAKEYMDAGGLVPDDIVCGVVKERIVQDDIKQNGFLLDGFPRTLGQAKTFKDMLKDSGIKLDVVLNLDVPDSELLDRLTGRRVCKTCGKTYHIKYNPPEEDGKCDADGGELYQRDDDTEKVIKNRLNEFHSKTDPLVDFYKNEGLLKTVNGNQSPDKVSEEAFKVLAEIE